MILTCPQCQTRYQTDAALFDAGGRKVRCAKCGHVWHQTVAPLAIAAEPGAASTAESELVANGPSVPPHTEFTPAATVPAHAPAVDSPYTRVHPRLLPVAAGWAGLLTLVVAIGWSAIRFREEIAILWPQTASFYEALGKPVNTRGLAIEDVSYRSETEDGQSVLAVTGRLANVTSHELSVPPIRITLTDGDRRVLYDWSFSAKIATLKAGQAESFLARLSSPPTGARHLQVHFAENKE